jgi:hypothetical protein
VPARPVSHGEPRLPCAEPSLPRTRRRRQGHFTSIPGIFDAADGLAERFEPADVAEHHPPPNSAPLAV